ncbi:hypothetical protein KDJ56_11025 [Brevibacillus composti]|uniref:Uncharacterized protein n=1 Tax=Brevibacillus composti TaxID=2796470 RepID=A0ABX7ZAJ1_9BACL|nr:hypothetical protein [Brevibacillus composti]QUO43433.1 hypothetical protein KDJ56_11025 [Brevibacillus composti]
MASTRGRTGTPVPKREVELRSTWSSECITRPMTEEERIKYGVKATPPKIRNADGIEERRPIQLPTRKFPHVTKDFVLAEFAKGKSVLQIEREQGMKPNTLYARLRTWGISSPHSMKRKSENEEARQPPTPSDRNRSDNRVANRIDDIFWDVQIELRRALGIEKEQRPKINRKKLAKEVAERWKSSRMTPLQLSHYFELIAGIMLGRIEAKTELKPNLFDTHRITDEEVGFLKFLKAIAIFHDRRNEIKTYGDIMAIVDGQPLVPAGKDGVENGEGQKQASDGGTGQAGVSS